MDTYNEFASVYARAGFSAYSAKMAELVEAMVSRFKVKIESILDVACGDGTFAVEMAKKGYKVTGVDLSAKMLGMARERSGARGAKVELSIGDMRKLGFRNRFDLATSWFDSLNYLLKPEELTRTFKGVAQALRKGGLFVFDMNTIFGLAFLYRQTSPVKHDSADIVMLHQFLGYDFDTHIVTMKLTSFTREGAGWKRSDEIHMERGYTLSQIRSCLKRAGLVELAAGGNPAFTAAPGETSARVWFVAQKLGR